MFQLPRKMKNDISEYRLNIPGTQEAFSDKVVPDSDGFTDEPVVQCDVQVVKNAFVGDSK